MEKTLNQIYQAILITLILFGTGLIARTVFPITKEFTVSERAEECLKLGGKYSYHRGAEKFENWNRCDVVKNISYK